MDKVPIGCLGISLGLLDLVWGPTCIRRDISVLDGQGTNRLPRDKPEITWFGKFLALILHYDVIPWAAGPGLRKI